MESNKPPVHQMPCELRPWSAGLSKLREHNVRASRISAGGTIGVSPFVLIQYVTGNQAGVIQMAYCEATNYRFIARRGPVFHDKPIWGLGPSACDGAYGYTVHAAIPIAPSLIVIS